MTKTINFIKEVRKQNDAINRILENDQDHLIFSDGMRSNIVNLQKRSNTILEKLEKIEFEIAIIGQEDSGKSALLNALIKTDIFPSGSGRTTYTSTKLISGNEDKVLVKTYTENEFNDIFIQRLSDAGIPAVDFSEMTIEKFNFDFEMMSVNEKERIRNNNTYNEIKEILDEKYNIERRLSLYRGKTVLFSGDAINGFKFFVTGKEGDKSQPRVAKDITIYSSMLKKLSDAIIYDVPGFNSPTTLHKKQTENMLKKADSIIFISDMTSPNLKGDEVDLLLKGNDSYGISLKEKLFIFGNKYDKANNKEEAEENKRKFKNDILSQRAIASEKRVFIGSAGKYLKDENISELDITFNFDIDDNIDSLRSAIENYYNNDRFEVIKKKIESIQSDIIREFNLIRDNICISGSGNFRSMERRIISKEERKIKQRLKHNLRNINQELKVKFFSEEHFSNYFIEKIPEYFKKISMDEVESYLPKYENDFDMINHKIRNDYLYDKFLVSFSKLISKTVDRTSHAVEANIFDKFVEAVKDDPTIRKEAKLVFDFQSQQGKFDYLFEWGISSILKLMILNPIASSKRKEDYERLKLEIDYIDNHYENDKSVHNIIKNGDDCPLLDNTPKSKKGSYSTEDVLIEINNDIENFCNILHYSIIPLLKLEEVYINRLEKEIRHLTNSLESDAINGFILNSIDIVAAEELSEINDQVDIYKRKQLIIDEVEKFLSENQYLIKSNTIQSIGQKNSSYSLAQRADGKISIIG